MYAQNEKYYAQCWIKKKNITLWHLHSLRLVWVPYAFYPDTHTNSLNRVRIRWDDPVTPSAVNASVGTSWCHALSD